jgi:hypothetical protein
MSFLFDCGCRPSVARRGTVVRAANGEEVYDAFESWGHASIDMGCQSSSWSKECLKRLVLAGALFE